MRNRVRTPAGKLSTLYNFCSLSNCFDGVSPYGTLMQATDGNLYGTALEGGALDYGTLFQITTSGVFKVLHNFDRDNGGVPFAGLMQATNGILLWDNVLRRDAPELQLRLWFHLHH